MTSKIHIPYLELKEKTTLLRPSMRLISIKGISFSTVSSPLLSSFMRSYERSESGELVKVLLLMSIRKLLHKVSHNFAADDIATDTYLYEYQEDTDRTRRSR